MFKNIKLKRFLKRTLFSAFTVINKIIPKKNNYILLYSANFGIRHNLKPLKEYLIHNGYNYTNKIICGIENMKYADKTDGLFYVGKIRSIMYFMCSKHVFYTTGQIPIKPSNNQIVIHLDHGAAGYKTFGALSNIHNGKEFYFTYYTAPSKLYVPIVVKALLCKEENVIINDEPVIDTMLTSKVKYNLGNYKKIGIWLPTFRQSDYLRYSDSSEENLIPMFEPEQYDELNNELKKYKIKLIVKIHSGQNLKKFTRKDFSNLDIITESDMLNRKWELYSLMAQMDFLVSDYSSAYLQYLLMDRPLGFVVPDFEEYQKYRGSVFDNPKAYMPGHIIEKKEELYAFLKDISEENDLYANERRIVCKKIHKYSDAGNCKRVIEISQIKK